jgi:hypothetical protein
MTNFSEKVKELRDERNKKIVNDYIALSSQNKLATQRRILVEVAKVNGVTEQTVRTLLISKNLYQTRRYKNNERN